MAKKSNLTASETVVAPPEIRELVEKFAEHRETYRQTGYNETQLRQDFLDPLFVALGWDVYNRDGIHENYRDVILEHALRVEKSVKAPDYCIRIGPVPKFFVEAKKPAVDIRSDVGPAFQLRRYAWTAKLPLSILTDFEEFAVYDCRVKPDKSDSAATARVMLLSYTEYVERWGEIAGIFSREAVLKGRFDEFAGSTKKKRGTAEVDEAFLEEIEGWREGLAKNLSLRNETITDRELNAAVQLIIDRIIFLRMCEGRGIEPYGRLQSLLNGDRVYPRLVEMFHRADEKYNSGLFHFQMEKGREPPDELTPDLTVDDKVLKDILRRLYYPESPYEFAALPADILGQVYEQFLGKVIRLTAGHRAKIEEKPEVRKAGGVYYTPTYIVDYIVQNTVGKLVEGKMPQEVGGLTATFKPAKGARPLAVLDPACGSGSFLIVAYQYLLDWYLKRYTEVDTPEQHSRGANPRVYQAGTGDWRLTTAERKRILLAHIYGVDIDYQAVEVTKLSLLLKALEGETKESVARMLFHKERALPDLANNIKCGNSLIGSDFYAGEQRGMFDEEEELRINAFDWQGKHGFPQIFSGKNPGFDSVIGNPPYGATLYQPEKDYFSSHYTCQNYQLDSYLLFIEQSLRLLLVGGGYFGMIVPNPWLTNVTQRRLRQFVVTHSHIEQIVHFLYPVFRKVTVDNEVVILRKIDPEGRDSTAVIVPALEALTNASEDCRPQFIRHKQDIWRECAGDVINIFLTDAERRLMRTMLNEADTLDHHCDINVGIKPYQTGKGVPPQTKRTVEDRPFDSTKQLSRDYRRYLRGKDIARYAIQPLEPRFIKYGVWLAEPRPAANFNAFVKLVMRQTGDSLIAALDDNQYLCLNNMHVLVPKASSASPLFLLGIINSRLLNWYYQSLNPEAGEALAEIKKSNVAQLPIRRVDPTNRIEKKQHDRTVDLVQQMLDLRVRVEKVKTDHERTVLERQIAATDREIDRLVYELYGLTEEEIAIVEAATK